MSIRLKVFLFTVWFLIFLLLLRTVKRKKADIRFVLPWLLLDIALAGVTAFPGILSAFCRMFGIETPSNMLFFFALVFLGMIVFSLSLSLSRQNAEIRELTQRLALREQEERKAEQRQKPEHGPDREPKGEKSKGEKLP
ncbi:MAG: DUF2304 domain-containing protein [Oscillospiraceae bacterium]|nr:DUF2304 domain-containing protein [Oscillospiraceae bacterium]